MCWSARTSPGSRSAKNRRHNRLAAERNLGGEARPHPRKAFDLKSAAESLDSIGQTAQAGSSAGVGSADPVISDLYSELAVIRRDHNGDA